MKKSPKKTTVFEKRLAQCKERVQQLQTCYQATSLLNAELNFPILLDTIMNLARQVAKADASSLLLMDKDSGDLTFQVALSAVGEQIKSLQRLKVGEGIAGTVAQTGRPLIIKDAYKHAKFNPDFDKKTGFKTGSILCAPLVFKGEVLGVCQVIHGRDKGKVFAARDLALFRLFCDSAALAIQNARMHGILLDKQRMEKDMEFAKTVQESFFQADCPCIDNFLFAAKTVPALVVGGDFYDFICFDCNRIAVVLGDVSGKGVSAALYMARLLSDFRYISQINPEPEAVLAKINNILFERAHRGMFATAMYLLIDPVKMTMKIGNAGHHALLLKNQGKAVEEKARAGGPPLGILPNVTFATEEIPLKTGDNILLYTDGLIEPKNINGEAFGLERLRKILTQNNLAPEPLLAHIDQSIKKFTGDAPKFDDLTTVAIQVM
jgi:sigma-B regulation protein RsbU (phosphoserine phosphatase)